MTKEGQVRRRLLGLFVCCSSGHLLALPAAAETAAAFAAFAASSAAALFYITAFALVTTMGVDGCTIHVRGVDFDLPLNDSGTRLARLYLPL